MLVTLSGTNGNAHVVVPGSVSIERLEIVKTILSLESLSKA